MKSIINGKKYDTATETARAMVAQARTQPRRYFAFVWFGWGDMPDPGPYASEEIALAAANRYREKHGEDNWSGHTLRLVEYQTFSQAANADISDYNGRIVRSW